MDRAHQADAPHSGPEMDEKLNYQWQQDPKGQFVNGHEREDVVNYRQNISLPSQSNIKAKT